MTNSIRHTPELSRILALPRRKPEDFPDEYIDRLTELLRTPTGTMRLRPAQALLLHDIGVYGGGFCMADVGQGKTIPSLLAPYVLDAKRPLLVLRASLIKKTEEERAELVKHWRIPDNIVLYSYEMLGRVQAFQFLETYQPDLIVADETQWLKNRRAAVTRRVDRYMKDHPETKFVALSATPMRKSIMNFAHILRWCLKTNAPIPRTIEECEEWALAIDEKVADEARFHPGALLKLCSSEDEGENDTVRARRGFQRRLLETPGVVSVIGAGEVVKAEVRIRAITYDVEPITEHNFRKLRGDPKNRQDFPGWLTPDDWPLSQPVDVWRHARELALGLFYKWDPRPPRDWLNARRDWAAFVREVLSRSRTLDSELQVAQACDAGRLDDEALRKWRAIRDTFKPNTVAVWCDDSALEVCLEWMRRPGLVWTEHSLFAERLAAVSGCKYYGARGFSADGEFINHADPTKSVIASFDANREGRNLQEKWHRCLFTSLTEGADALQQAIGRFHRPGQRSAHVEVDVLLGCIEHANAWRKALAAAQAIKDTTGANSKLLTAKIDWPTEDEIASFSGWRWGNLAYNVNGRKAA